MNYHNIFVVKKRSVLFIVIAIIFSFITAMRGNTPDTINYKSLYNEIDRISLNPSTFYDQTYMEYGFGLITAFFKYLNFDFSFFLFFYAFLTFIFIKKASDNFGINNVVVLFCYLPTFYFLHQWAQIRQGLAIAIAYYSISVAIKNEQHFKSFIFYIISVSIHNVATPFIIFFKNILFKLLIKLNKYYYIIAIILFISTILLCRIFSGISFDFSDRLSGYSTYEESRGLLHPVNLRAYALLLFFLLFRTKSNTNNIILDFLILTYVIGVGIRLGFYDFLILSGRLGTIFTYSEIFIIPLILSLRFNKITGYIFAFIYFSISLYLSLFLQTPEIIDQYFQPLP
ncbi:EpsG family protein [Acinetobacter baumannii]